ncbi:ATP-binding protein [Pseudomonas solani]|uniref:AAA family ATPase n=1 Tax=Pseudomonas solani TaxID=2731552 RepID=UPI0035BE76ED
MHYFINFKNYSQASINLFSNFTLLIGKNGSGKSNLIEGVELLAAIAEGKPLHEMVDGKSYSPNSFPIRGGIHSCVKFDCDEFSLGFSGVYSFLGAAQPFDYRVSVSVDPFPRISQEYLTVGKRKIFYAITDGDRKDGMLDVQFDNFARGGTKPHRKFYGDRSIMSRYEELIQANEAGDKGNKLKAVQMVAAIKRYIQSSFVFDPNPKLMRDYVRVGQNILLKDGSNISAVLQNIAATELDKKSKNHSIANILRIVTQVPEEPFADFEFIQTRQHDTIFAIKSGERIVDARLISDGTLRVLAVITALESIPRGSRVVIEEFDNGLHPSRAELLISAIREIVKRRELNILLSTHNPASLNSLDNDWLQNVHVCHWDDLHSTSKLTKLLEIPKVDSLLESGNLGDLVTRSIFEKHLQPQFSEDKKAKALDWLEKLK